MDGCPLGLGLVVEDKLTEFSCSTYMCIGGSYHDQWLVVWYYPLHNMHRISSAGL